MGERKHGKTGNRKNGESGKREKCCCVEGEVRNSTHKRENVKSEKREMGKTWKTGNWQNEKWEILIECFCVVGRGAQKENNRDTGKLKNVKPAERKHWNSKMEKRDKKRVRANKKP